MTAHTWRDPTLVWLRLRQLQYIAVRLGQQTGKPLASMHAMERLQEELFHTAQLLPPPPEKPYYTYEPPVQVYSEACIDLLRGRTPRVTKTWDIPNLRERIMQVHTLTQVPSMAEQLLGRMQILVES